MLNVLHLQPQLRTRSSDFDPLAWLVVLSVPLQRNPLQFYDRSWHRGYRRQIFARPHRLRFHCNSLFVERLWAMSWELVGMGV